MQTNMKKDTVTGEYDLLEKLQVKQERVYGWTCACISTEGKGPSKREKGETRLSPLVLGGPTGHGLVSLS